jgi:hypothetical protein
MFSGLSRVDHWPTHSMQLNHAHQLYDYFLKHLEAMKFHKPDSDELTVSPLSKYIKILGDAGDFQRIFDVYYAMESEGPLAANQEIFTAIFQVLSVKRSADGDGNTISHYQNNSTARLLWTQMEKASKKSPGFAVDSHLIAAAIRALCQGRPIDHEFALDIVRDRLGMVRPDEMPVDLVNTELSVHTLAAALESCNEIQKHRVCVHYLQQVMHPRCSGPRGRAQIIDRGHIEQGLKAYAVLAQSRIPGQSLRAVETLEWMLRSEIMQSNVKLRPRLITFNLVLSACRAQGDWAGATRTFDLMSGYKSGDFADLQALKGISPLMETRSKGRNIMPDAEVMSSMVRTALVTRVSANVRQVLRMVDHFNVDHLLNERISLDELPQPRKVAKLDAFFHSKLAVALEEAVDIVMKMDPQVDEIPRWRHLKARAKAYIEDGQGGNAQRMRATNRSSRTKPNIVETGIKINVRGSSQKASKSLLLGDTEIDILQEKLTFLTTSG